MKFAAAIAAAGESDAVLREAPATVPGRKVHIDGDYLCYYASGNDETDPGWARQNALDYIQRAKVNSGAEKAVLHLTASGCHKGERYLVATRKPYQGQRSSDRRPKNWRYLRDWSVGYEGAEFIKKVWSTREADDGIAACAEWAASRGSPDVTCTADKDMRMLPGLHLDWKSQETVAEVPHDGWEVLGTDGKVYGEKWFWLQMLHGDTADNIPGLEFAFVPTLSHLPPRLSKVGPATALKILSGLQEPQDIRQAVQDAYLTAYKGTGDGPDRFAEQAALLWLRRDNVACVKNCSAHLGDRLVSSIHVAFERLHQRVQEARHEANKLAVT